jgi:sulfopropanediol 3-dehydrogenase
MSENLKRGRAIEQTSADARKVRETVEAILADIESRGEAAVRERSRAFDKWDPESFRLSKAQIDACLSALTPRQVADICFAQEQVRRFAEAQKSALQTDW